MISIIKKALILGFVLALPAYAQDSKNFAELDVFEKDNEDDVLATDPDKRVAGHHLNATSGANLIDNQNVVGQQDGRTSIYSLGLTYRYLHLKEHTEWLSALRLTETMSKTPNMNRLIKTDDILILSTMYKSFLPSHDWLGAFARAEAQAPILDGYDERTETVNYSIQRRSGEVDVISDERLLLNKGLKPLVLKQSLGGVAKILDKKSSHLEVRGGLGAKQIMAKNQLLVNDNKDTDGIIEVSELNDVSLVGIESGVEWSGNFAGLDYRLFAEALYPLNYTPRNDSDPAPSELVSTETGAELSYFLQEWLSLNYKLSTRRDPILTDKTQVVQNFLVALAYSLSSNPTSSPN